MHFESDIMKKLLERNPEMIALVDFSGFILQYFPKKRNAANILID